MHSRSSLAALATLTMFCATCSKGAAPSALVGGDAGLAPSMAPGVAPGVAIPQAPVVAEVEPNDTPEAAQKVDRTATINGLIEPVQPATKPDEDWFAVTAAQPADLTVRLSYRGPLPAVPPTGKFVLEAYDRDHDRIEARSGALIPGPLANLPAIRVRDVVYLRVAGAMFPYTLDVRLDVPDPNAEAEPNDRAVDATPLALDHPIHGSYATAADQDYYLLELSSGATSDAGVPAPPSVLDASVGPPGDASAPPPSAASPNPGPTEMLRIEVTGVPGVRHSLTVLDDGKTALGTFTSREPGEPLLVRDFALRPGLGRVYLLLEAWHGHKKATVEFPAGQPYALTVHRESAPSDLELEPNDTLDLATPLVVRAPGASARRIGFLAPAGDVDDYRLHLDAPARVHLSLSALDQVDTELSVVEPDPSSASGKTLLKVNEGGTKEPEVIPAIALTAGDHIVRVQAAAHLVGTKWVRDQADPDHTYQLDAELAADDGSFEREPNDSAATATTISPGQPLSGYAFPAKDVDVYRLDLSTQPVAAGVTLHLSATAKVPLELELREAGDGKLGELLNTSDPGKAGVDAQIQQKLDPAVYYLVVKPHPVSRDPGVPQADAETPYRLSVQLE